MAKKTAKKLWLSEFKYASKVQRAVVLPGTQTRLNNWLLGRLAKRHYFIWLNKISSVKLSGTRSR